MIILSANDGSPVDKDKLNEKGFWDSINKRRDIRYQNRYEYADDEEEEANAAAVYCFVGFVANANSDLLVVLPKCLETSDSDFEAKNLFEVIKKHAQRHPSLYIGPNASETYVSNYPFAAYFAILNYYTRFGLYRENEVQVKRGLTRSISWKDTLKRSIKYVVDDEVAPFPVYGRKKQNKTSLITACMAFALDYTASKFGAILHAPLSGYDIPTEMVLNNRKGVIEHLIQERSTTFRDTKLNLLDALIDFYRKLNFGGSLYLKHYKFDLIWQDIAMEYLCSHYEGMETNGISLSVTPVARSHFERKRFYPNLANPRNCIDLDYYYIDRTSKEQLIFDAKYKTNLRELDYKQLAYHFILANRRNDSGCEPLYRVTRSALILPGIQTGSRLHFEMDPAFNKEFADMKIFEERIDVKRAIEYYVNGS